MVNEDKNPGMKPFTKAKFPCGRREKCDAWIWRSTFNKWFLCGCLSLDGFLKGSVEAIVKWDWYKCSKPAFLTEPETSASEEHNAFYKNNKTRNEL